MLFAPLAAFQENEQRGCEYYKPGHGASQDCQPNTTPDECELAGNDCNANNVPDDCDIATGTSTDCDTNGIPDECEIAGHDCNGNGTLDVCDIDAGTSQDCQPDGIPDDCQLAGNDCNGNSIPDDCDINVALPVSISFNLDSNPGWSTESLWAFGVPAGLGSHNHDPSSGYTGSNVYGYNLNGDYASNIPNPGYFLTTTALNCSGWSGTELRFYRWLGVERYDRAIIDVSKDGTNWTRVFTNSSTVSISEYEWSYQTYNISAVANGQAAVYLRWGMGPTDGSTTYPGWNIDDIEIHGFKPLSQDCNANDVPDECDVITLGDYNADGNVDLADYPGFVECLAGPGVPPQLPAAQCVPACLAAFDFDADNDVDLEDFAAFTVYFAP